ncbi:MAG TPA: response regulator [Gammaproteobacteria bacterium]|nr:response regulator [Gammaproteobacteria bacterium]
MIKVLVVDDHALIRMAIKSLLIDAPGIKVIGEAASGEEAVVLAKELIPDVVILDIDMPGIGGLGAIPKLLNHQPAIKVLILTIYDAEPYPTRLIEAGAHGYLTKGCQPEELIKAIRAVYAGESYISPRVAQNMAAKRFASEPESPFNLLSKREFQIVLMLIQGVPPKEISEKLFLNMKTVNGYRYLIFKKLHVYSDVELTLLALRHGLLESEKM